MIWIVIVVGSIGSGRPPRKEEKGITTRVASKATEAGKGTAGKGVKTNGPQSAISRTQIQRDRDTDTTANGIGEVTVAATPILLES